MLHFKGNKIMRNIKAIQAFLTTKLSGELTIISTSNALKQWQHGDIAPAIDTLQALTGKPYAIVKTDTLEAKKATLITALKTASGADNVKSRLHALGETLEAINGTTDYLDLAGNVPDLIKLHLAECKAERALRKAEKQSEVITITPATVKAANDNLPAFHAETPAINSIADIISNLAQYSEADKTSLFEALAASLGYDLKMVEAETA
jgi:hypothetical protein